MAEHMVHFPWLHPKLAQGPMPEGVVFFDPGVDMHTERRRWRPEDLPCSPGEVRGLLRSYMEFGERFPRASDMQAYKAMGLENFYTDTTMEIRSQLQGGVPAAPANSDQRRQAQLLLAMALYREEQFVAMREQEGPYDAAREGFAEVLGLDDEESCELGVPVEASSPGPAQNYPGSPCFPPCCALPADSRLFVSDADVLRELVSLDFEFSPCGQDGDLQCCRLDEEGLERLCGIRANLSGTLTIVAPSLQP
jgi:hypothetical protein